MLQIVIVTKEEEKKKKKRKRSTKGYYNFLTLYLLVCLKCLPILSTTLCQSVFFFSFCLFEICSPRLPLIKVMLIIISQMQCIIYNRSWVVIVARSKKTVISRDEEKLMSNFSIYIRDIVFTRRSRESRKCYTESMVI